jgi:hypothetical protein
VMMVLAVVSKRATHPVAAPCCVGPPEPPSSALLLLLPKHDGPRASPPAGALEVVLHHTRMLLRADHEGSRLGASQINLPNLRMLLSPLGVSRHQLKHNRMAG